ncbi:MAG TPA: EAL domain-containing protein [Patescibacteria group bacterium]|nr:EAL domain-containing protein [Patescibacteria group bacterium]
MTLATPASPRILIVDDEDAIRGLIALALRRAGFEVLEASSGKAALDAVEARSVDLIVLDIGMPGMSGIDVVRALRSRPDSMTLPILLLTGSGDGDDVVPGLDAGADDFLSKPARLDELVARVNAHLRRQAAWAEAIEEALRSRAGVVAALGRLPISPVPEEAAEAVVREVAARTEIDFVAILQVGLADELQELATYDRSSGVRSGGHLLDAMIARHVLGRAREGPWVEEVGGPGVGALPSPFASATTGLPTGTPVAGAPIYSGDDLVAILAIGLTEAAGSAPLLQRTRLLATAIDYASVFSTRTGSVFAGRRDVAAARARLWQVLEGAQFHPVYQPIVELETKAIVGFEALTRFDDGIRPDVRFAEAANVGLGADFELATIHAALDGAARLADGAFLSLNCSPGFVLNGDRRLRRLLKGASRRLVIELTEHVAIENYGVVRRALARLGNHGVAVDDAGAGYASFRHILELRPDYAKLDVSLIRGIEGDDLRQALVAGLQYFADRTGCRIIAEGVETEAQAEVLLRLGVEYGQGYLYGRPELAT